MGYMRHHAIVVTSWSGVAIDKAHLEATSTFPEVSPIITSDINIYHSFFIPPDGSKEGWDESNVGDGRRDAFISWIHTLDYEDGSNPLAWAEIQYGDDAGISLVVRHSDEARSSHD